MKAYLVMDIGTSATKVILYSTDGKQLISQNSTYDVQIPKAGWAEQDPQIWWRAICKLCLKINSNLGDFEILAVVVIGQAPSCAPIDRQGNPLHPAILWLDRRSIPQVDWLKKYLGEEQAQAISTNRIDSYFGGVKWLWFIQKHPGLFRKTWKILQANSYIVYKLTNRPTIDPSQAGLCSPCFDSSTGSWSDNVLDLIGLPVEKLPEIVPASSIVECGISQEGK